MYTAFLHNIKLSGHKMGVKFDKDLLAVEQNNYLTKILNVYIVYEEILPIISNLRLAYLDQPI